MKPIDPGTAPDNIPNEPQKQHSEQSEESLQTANY